MSTDLLLRRKWTLQAGNRRLILHKKPIERTEHVLMKAFLWALYLPDYENLLVEYTIDDRYKPDVVALDEQGIPQFWGEAGKVHPNKIDSLIRRYPNTHFAIAKWSTRLEPYVKIVEKILAQRSHNRPFDLINLPADAAEQFIRDDGRIHIRWDEVTCVRL